MDPVEQKGTTMKKQKDKFKDICIAFYEKFTL